MTFAIEKNTPASRKITLVEFDLPASNDDWINYEAGIWRVRLTQNGQRIEDDYGLIGYYDGDPDAGAAVVAVDANNRVGNYYNVKSFRCGNELFTRVTSIVNLRAQNKSFYYDTANTFLYVHFDAWSYPWQYNNKIGYVNGFCDDVGTSAYYDDQYYDPRLLEFPTISKQKDPLSFGVMTFNDGAIRLDNTDGHFDDYEDLDIYGQPVRVLLGFYGMEYADFEQIYSGFIEDIERTPDEFVININDPRKKLSRQIPVRTFEYSEYPDLNESTLGKPKPIAYGEILDAPCICLNQEDPTGPYEFMFMDTTDHSAESLDTVRIDGITDTPSSYDLDTGTFWLTSDQCMPDGNLLDVTCDFHGSAIVNAVAVIEDINTLYADIAYISDNYNTTTCDDTEDNRALDVGLYIGEKKEISEIFSQICESCFMMYDIERDGKIAIKYFDKTAAADRTINDDEWLTDPEEIFDRDYLYTSVEVSYSPLISDGSGPSVIDTTYQDEAYAKYREYKEIRKDTILTSSTDAATLAASIAEECHIIHPVVTRKTGIQNIDLDLMEIVLANHRRISAAPRELPYEVIGVEAERDYSVSLTMRRLYGYTDTIAAENMESCTGDISTGVTLDETNAEGGTIPDDCLTYALDHNYGDDYFTATAYYESDILYNSEGFYRLNWLATGDAGDVMMQYKTAGRGQDIDAESWSAEIDAVTYSQVVLDTRNPYLRYRFVFYSPNWSDSDSVRVLEAA